MKTVKGSWSRVADAKTYSANHEAIFNKRRAVSNCCGAGYRLAGNVTKWHECEKCGEPCDVIRRKD